MKATMTAIALGMAAMGVTVTATMPAHAAQEQKEREMDISKDARKALVPLQEAVVGGEYAKVPELAAAAKAAAKTNDDKVMTNRLLLKAAVDQKDYEAAIEPIDALGALGEPLDTYIPVYVEVGKQRLFDENYTGAEELLTKALEYQPNNSDALVALAETKSELGQTDEAIKVLSDAIAAAEKANGKADENWYKRAVKLAYDEENTAVFPISRSWVRAYPSADSWRDALRIYMSLNDQDPGKMLDLMRLQFAAQALESEGDYLIYAEELLRAGYPGEAKAVIDAGKAAAAFDMDKRIVKEILANADTQVKGDRAAVDAEYSAALSGSAPKKAITIGDAYYGYGEYQKAAELYRAALGKSGVSANVANLRLGMALARAGDYAAAKAALDQVGGPEEEAAAYWKLWVDLQS